MYSPDYFDNQELIARYIENGLEQIMYFGGFLNLLRRNPHNTLTRVSLGLFSFVLIYSRRLELDSNNEKQNLTKLYTNF